MSKIIKGSIFCFWISTFEKNLKITEFYTPGDRFTKGRDRFTEGRKS
jgi:hypothetical protein